MFELQFLDKNDYYRAGAENTILIKDLKTLKGVVNRLKRNYYYLPDNWFKVVILSYHKDYIYNQDMHKEVLVLYKKNYIYKEDIKQAN